jgi:hypothetical protein
VGAQVKFLGAGSRAQVQIFQAAHTAGIPPLGTLEPYPGVQIALSHPSDPGSYIAFAGLHGPPWLVGAVHGASARDRGPGRV